jgi:hypothetical protein
MAKGEKVNLKAKPPPSPNDEEINYITKNLARKTKLFITKLMED